MYLIGVCGFAARPSVFANAASNAVHNEVRVRTVLLKSVSYVCRLQLGKQLGALPGSSGEGKLLCRNVSGKKRIMGSLCLSGGILRMKNAELEQQYMGREGKGHEV